MRPRGVDVVSLGGVRVAIDWSWLLVLALVTASLALGYLPARHPGLAARTYWLAGLVVALLLFASIVAHELSHALVARRLGVRVERVTLFVFGGLARLEAEPRDPGADLVIALAGPLTSLWLAGVLYLTHLALAGRAPASLAVAALGHLALANLALAVFNALPGLPLDGGRVLRSYLWRRSGDFDAATARASDWGRGVGAGVAALGLVVVLAGTLLGGLWLVLVGMFVRTAAGAARDAAVLERALRRTTVRDLMVEHPVVVEAATPVADVVAGAFLRHGFGGYPVLDEGRVVGLVSLAEVERCPPGERARRTVGEVMRAADDAVRIAPDAPLEAALRRMRDAGTTRLLVMDGERLVGLVTQTGIMRAVGIRLSLARADATGSAGAS